MDRECAVFLPEALILDVEEIDDQHAALFARLAVLKEHCIEANCLPCGEGAALLDALRIHFATEECMAIEAGLDFVDHIQKHQIMLKRVAGAIEQVLTGKSDAFSLIRYLEYWFERHIHDEDVRLGERLHAAAGSAPQMWPASFDEIRQAA